MIQIANFQVFTLNVQVEGPADVTVTGGMPDAERKERQVSYLRMIRMRH